MTGRVLIGGAGAAPSNVHQHGGFRVRIGGHGHQKPRGYRVPGGPKRKTVVCTMEGVPQAFLVNARHGDVTWEANQPDAASFAIPVDDPAAEAILGPDITPGRGSTWGISEPMREVTLWRGDDCLTWGPAAGIGTRDGQFDVSVDGLARYFAQRFIGFANPQNLLEPNADFDAGDTGWRLAVIDLDDPANIIVRPAVLGPDCYVEVARHPRSGRLALHIHNTSDPLDNPFLIPCAWKEQNFTAVGYERAIKGSAECWVENFDGPNNWEEGLSLAGAPLNEPTPLTKNFTLVDGSRLDDDHPSGDDGEARRHTVSITVPPATTGKVQFMLKGCKGDTWWEFPRCELDGSMAFVAEDIATMAFKLCDHLGANFNSGFVQAWQNPNYPYSQEGYGKSPLGFDTRSDPVGIVRTVLYSFASRVNGLSSLQGLMRPGQLEFWFEYAPAATSRRRLFCTARAKGRWRRDLPLRFGPGSKGNLTDAAWSFNGHDIANSIVMLSSGGAGQPEGSAIDDTSFAGGLTLEKVLHAPAEARPDQLDRLAQLEQQNSIAPTVAVKLPASPYFEQGLRVGDRVPLAIHYGPFHIVDDEAWITRMTLTGDDYLEMIVQRYPGNYSP